MLIAHGEANYFISIEATLSVLFCIEHKQGDALANCFREFLWVLSPSI